MKNASLGRWLCFALFAGFGTLAFQLTLGLVLGGARGLCLYLLALAVLAAIVLAPSVRRGATAGLLASVLCTALALTNPSLGTAWLGVLVVLGLVRSAIFCPRPFARALGFELALGLVSSALFALIYDGSVLGSAVAIWSFWLVQSAFAILPPAPARSAEAARDPFEAAAAAAERVLDQRA